MKGGFLPRALRCAVFPVALLWSLPSAIGPGRLVAQDLDFGGDLEGSLDAELGDADEEGTGDEVQDDVQDGEPQDQEGTSDDPGAPPAEDAVSGVEAASATARPLDALDAPGAPDAGRWLAFEVSVGMGIGTRGFERPIAGGTQRLPDTGFAAASISARTRLWPADTWSFDLLTSYQTSLGMRVREQAPFALPEDINVRAHRFAVAVAPTLRLSAGPRALSLALPVGFVARNFWPQADQYQTPEFTLGGLLVRPEVVVPITAGVRVRLGPEVQWLSWLDGTLVRSGVCCQGFAFGGQGSLQADLSSSIAVELFYRESHATAPANTDTFSDVERFITAGLLGRL